MARTPWSSRGQISAIRGHRGPDPGPAQRAAGRHTLSKPTVSPAERAPVGRVGAGPECCPWHAAGSVILAVGNSATAVVDGVFPIVVMTHLQSQRPGPSLFLSPQADICMTAYRLSASMLRRHGDVDHLLPEYEKLLAQIAETRAKRFLNLL